MPSTPSESSPFMDSVLQRQLGPRTPGTPSSAGKPGVQAGGVSFPNPPGVNTGAPGRPPSVAPAPAPGGVSNPSMASAPARPGSSGAGGFPTPPVPQPPQPAKTTQPVSVASVPAPGAPTPPAAPQVDALGNPIPTGPPVVQSSRIPGAGSIAATQPPGTQVQTPYGTVEADPSGKQTTTLSPEGQQRYKEQKAALRQKLGPMPKVFQGLPGLPEFPIELGSWNYNPFTGQSGKD